MCGQGFVCRQQGLFLQGGEAEKSKGGFLKGSKHGRRGTWEGDEMEDPKWTKGDALLDASLGNTLQMQAVCSPWVLWRKKK